MPLPKTNYLVISFLNERTGQFHAFANKIEIKKCVKRNQFEFENCSNEDYKHEVY